MLSDIAKRMLAAGSNALALDTDPEGAMGIARETADWLETRFVVLRIRGTERARVIGAFLAAFPNASFTFSFGGEARRIECAVTAPWTVISLVTLTFFEDIQGICFPESEEEACRSI
jgi:hypothetical protein